MAQRRWLEFEDDSYRFIDAKLHRKIPAAVYKVEANDNGVYLEKHTITKDKLYLVEDTISAEITDEIKSFWALKDKYAKLELIHKRGFLIWGPPGTGKTSTLNMIAEWIIQQDGIILFGQNPGYLSSILSDIRKIEPERPMAIFLEDFEEMVRRSASWERDYLAILDGEDCVDNVVFIATSNYPEDLDPRFIDRPSRFDTIKYLGKPNRNFIRVYIDDKLGDFSQEIRNELFNASEELTVAQLKEAIIQLKIYELSVDETIKKVTLSVEEKLTPPKGDKVIKKKGKGIGFAGANYELTADAVKGGTPSKKSKKGRGQI